MAPTILLFEYDRVHGGWRWPCKVEKIGPMTRIIFGWWSIAIFKDCGINDMWAAFRTDERERLFKIGRLKDSRL
jgi:hypothetical protein